jgi:hypothetical protein
MAQKQLCEDIGLEVDNLYVKNEIKLECEFNL